MSKFLSVFLLLAILLTIGGVYASWSYAAMDPVDVDQSFGVGLEIFEFHPEDILPGGDDQEAELGQNHFGLIDLILNENDKNYGMNYDNKEILINYAEKQDAVYCNQKISGGNLKFILDTSNNTHELYYCVQRVSDTLYYAYTFSTAELATKGGSQVEILAYRTSLELTDKWRATVSYEGYALTRSLRDLGASASSGSIGYSIDVNTWHM